MRCYLGSFVMMVLMRTCSVRGAYGKRKKLEYCGIEHVYMVPTNSAYTMWPAHSAYAHVRNVRVAEEFVRRCRRIAATRLSGMAKTVRSVGSRRMWMAFIRETPSGS